MTQCELLGRRIWALAKTSATEDEKWRMQFYLMKARQAANEGTKLRFMASFHELAGHLIERTLPAAALRLPALSLVATTV